MTTEKANASGTILPELSSDYALLPEQIEELRRDGHVLLRGVCSPDEVEAYRDLISGAARRFNTETRPLSERDTYGRAFLQVMNLWAQDAARLRFRRARLARARRSPPCRSTWGASG